MMDAKNPLAIYTDGGCSGNPGPGAWAYVVIEGADLLTQAYGSEALTTNNRMELMAVIKALEAVMNDGVRDRRIIVHTDSQYVQKGISAWILKWKANGWRTSTKEPVKNQDLWRRLDENANALSVEWRWVKGHAGDEYNELCDRLTQKGIAEVNAFS